MQLQRLDEVPRLRNPGLRDAPGISVFGASGFEAKACVMVEFAAGSRTLCSGPHDVCTHGLFEVMRERVDVVLAARGPILLLCGPECGLR